MNRIFRLTVVLFVLSIISVPAFAQTDDISRKLGFGAALQTQNTPRAITPTGISFRAVLGERVSINAVSAFTLGPDVNSWYLQGDIILSDSIDDFDIEEELDQELPFTPYFGVGVRALVGNRDNLLGIRVPVGLQYDILNAPMDVYIEIAPTFDIDPRFLFSFGGGLGFRYYIF